MAEIIPPLNKQTLARMTAGEKRVARRLRDWLEDDYLVWYDIPVGSQRRYPDFIVLHPSRGLLFLEVKDWKPDTLKKISKSDVSLLTPNGLVTRAHPLEQVRQCAYAVIDRLSRDPQLQQTHKSHRGNLIMPYGWGVIFTNISRQQIEKAIADEFRESLLPDHLMIYKNELGAAADAETFQEQLWGMFNYQFGNSLTLPQIDRIRWHLFPEIRIDSGGSADLFSEQADDEPTSLQQDIPDMIKIMDIQQEQLARSLGEGHRVIHGVAGSGKTLILGYRCLHLAQAARKPILVLCFNITLAARLRSFISSRGIGNQVQIYHFHDWCSQQIRTYHIRLLESEAPVWERQVESVIQAVDKGDIPRAQYDALMIDEGHDFQAEWLQLVTQMVDPDSNSLLLLYDDAQSIYQKKSGLGFSLSSVGIQAKGRTTVLRLNYRNSREILHYAYEFASHYLHPVKADDDHIPLLKPQAAGGSGPLPVVKKLTSFDEEMQFARACVQKWHQQGVALKDIAILYTSGKLGKGMSAILQTAQLSHLWLGRKQSKAAYDPQADQLTVLTLHSSKGLEFRRVIILGTGLLGQNEERIIEDARLLYVGMTRAQEALLLTTSTHSGFCQQLIKLAQAEAD
ncbi:MAG: NERD domain-containing protein/DEAD/DEAH box helicase [gamma proteobacterium symbiont of Bathyaustriella thionipta]|nr:NERD domain-containing protein/DEAD/DEAH box helicase [gamma proteobacterium symbiont of Bathyaustriella thionipta]